MKHDILSLEIWYFSFLKIHFSELSRRLLFTQMFPYSWEISSFILIKLEFPEFDCININCIITGESFVSIEEFTTFLVKF